MAINPNQSLDAADDSSAGSADSPALIGSISREDFANFNRDTAGSTTDVSPLVGNVEINVTEEVQTAQAETVATDATEGEVADTGDGQEEATDGQAEVGDQPKELKNPGDIRTVEREDGSKIAEMLFPDGEIRPVVHLEPDGKTQHEFKWEEQNGKWQVTEMQDTLADGTKIHQKKLNDGWWSIESPQGKMHTKGEMNVLGDGTLIFKNAADDPINPGGEYTRKSDGSEVAKTKNGVEVLNNPAKERAEPAESEEESGQPSDAETETDTEGEGRPKDGDDEGDDRAEEGDGEIRVVENPEDGSRIEYKTVNGKEVISKVVRPSGEYTEYGHDDDGNVNKLVDYDEDGNELRSSQKQGGLWKLTERGNSFNVPGELKLEADGSHVFTESLTGNVFKREPDGSSTYKTATGQLLAKEGKQQISEDRKKQQDEHLGR